MSGIAHNRTLCLTVSCIANELWIPNANPWLSRCIGRKNANRRANITVIGWLLKVLDDRGKDLPKGFLLDTPRNTTRVFSQVQTKLPKLWRGRLVEMKVDSDGGQITIDVATTKA